MNNTITSNEITKLFGWFDQEFPDFDGKGEQNTQERWYAYLSPTPRKTYAGAVKPVCGYVRIQRYP